MTKIHIRGLVPKISEPFHGLVMVRFASPLSPADRTRAEARLCEVGGLTEIPPEETTEEESLFVAGIYPGVDGSGISGIRETLQDLAREFGAVKAVFAEVSTEIDGVASQQDVAAENEDDESPEKSFWKAGPPPGVQNVPFHLERYPDAIKVFDWEDFGIAMKFRHPEQPGEQRLLDAVHRFWLSPYVDSAISWPKAGKEGAEDEDGGNDRRMDGRFFLDSAVNLDSRHHSALFWVDGFAVPAKAADMVHHLLWILTELHKILPIAYARFDDVDMEMKYGKAFGDRSPYLVLAANPILTLFESEGEEAASAWAESQSDFSAMEIAAMFMEVGNLCDHEGEEGQIALRMFDRASAVDPSNEEAVINAIFQVCISGDIQEALHRISSRNDLTGYMVKLVLKYHPKRIGEIAHLLTPEFLQQSNANILTPLVKGVANHAPEHLDKLLAAIPEREQSVGFLHDSIYGVTDRKRQLQVLLRVLELPLVDKGLHRDGYLSAYNSSCILAHALKDYPLAVDLARRAAPYADENPYIHHSAACAHAAVGDLETAFEHVKGAVRTNYDHLDRLEKDVDLGPILDWPEHKKLFADLRVRRARSEPVMEATDDTFDREVLALEQPVLVDFTAGWCGPCRRIAPIIETLARESEGRYRVVKVDIDKNKDTCLRYNVRSVPTLIVFDGSEERARHVGLTDKRALLNLLRTSGVLLM